MKAIMAKTTARRRFTRPNSAVDEDCCEEANTAFIIGASPLSSRDQQAGLGASGQRSGSSEAKCGEHFLREPSGMTNIPREFNRRGRREPPPAAAGSGNSPFYGMNNIPRPAGFLHMVGIEPGQRG